MKMPGSDYNAKQYAQLSNAPALTLIREIKGGLAGLGVLVFARYVIGAAIFYKV